MQLYKACQNCSNFIQDSDNLKTSLGICLNDGAFEPFSDEVMGNADFTNCFELYLEKRFDGESEVCDRYEEYEMIEASDCEDIEGYLYIEQMKNANVDELIKHFYDDDNDVVISTISMISSYVYIGNENAYEGLINYYMSLGSAISLEDVHLRIKIIDILSSKDLEKNMIVAYINELTRTPSNNTTRKLYTKILERLSKYPLEMVLEPLMALLEEKEFSYKIKKKIMEVATIRETNEYLFR